MAQDSAHRDPPGMQARSLGDVPLLEDLKVASGGGLWPRFSAGVANYEVRLDASDSEEEAPSLELELALPSGPRPRLRIDGEELPALEPSERLLRHRVRLPRLSPGSRRARYQLVRVEALPPEGGAAAGQCLRYFLRVLPPPDAAAQPPSAGPPPSAPARALVAKDRALAVVPTSQTAVGISLVGGSCTRTAGPFRTPLHVPASAGRLGLWSAGTQHVLCFPTRSSGGEDRVQFVATAADSTDASSHEPGKFGFGPGVAVSLRPDIETNAIWPLEAGVQSLSLGLGSGESFRALALRTTDGGTVADTPVVVARAARPRWPIAVQLLNVTMGSCSAAASVDAARFVCRAREDAAGALAQFVLFCQACMFVSGKTANLDGQTGEAKQAWSVSILDGEGRSVPTSLGADGQFVPGVAVPWIGWSATAPREGSPQQWIVRLRPASSSRAARGDVDATDFEVALVVGDSAVPWTLGPASEGVFEAAGTVLSLLLAATLATAAAVLVLASCGFPAPTLAMLPSLTCAATALQFLALLASCPGSPKLLQSLCRPLAWAVPGPPVRGLPHTLLALLGVAIVHAGAVWRYLMLNGNGSAKALPHGLVFGAWELRALGLLALPLAAAGAELLFRARAWYVPGAMLGGTLLVGLVAAAVGALRRMRGWFADERVVRVPLPSCPGKRIYVDRLCDQLRAVPTTPGPARLLGDWPASPGWSVAPAVAAIRDLEHRGAPMPGCEQGPWGASWPQGPWAPQRGSGQPPQTARPGGSSYARQASNGSVLSTMSEGQMFYKELVSPVFNEHPIRASLEFPYEGGKYPCVAGVVGLPWVDVAVLADALCTIESMAGHCTLQVHVGQLSGPLTSGRLAACFDWGDSRPWRWPVDILMKVCLGAYLGALSSGRDSAMTTGAAWLHVAFAACIMVVAAAALAMRPYSHFIDNLALVVALLAISVGIAVRCGAEQLPGLTPAATSALVPLSLAPLVLAFVAASVALAFTWRWRRQDLHDKVLPATVREWGSSVTGGIGRSLRGDKYFGVWCEDTSASAEVDNASAYSRTADVVLLSLSDGLGATKSRIALPAEMKIPLAHRELRGRAGQGPACPPVSTGRVRVPVPVGMLFTPAQDGVERAAAKPFAALLTPQGGQLLYSEAALNGDLSWNEALRSFFQDSQSLANEAETFLREHEREMPAGGDSLMPVLEFNGTMESSSNPSWRTCK